MAEKIILNPAWVNARYTFGFMDNSFKIIELDPAIQAIVNRMDENFKVIPKYIKVKENES